MSFLKKLSIKIRLVPMPKFKRHLGLNYVRFNYKLPLRVFVITSGLTPAIHCPT